MIRRMLSDVIFFIYSEFLVTYYITENFLFHSTFLNARKLLPDLDVENEIGSG